MLKTGMGVGYLCGIAEKLVVQAAGWMTGVSCFESITILNEVHSIFWEQDKI